MKGFCGVILNLFQNPYQMETIPHKLPGFRIHGRNDDRKSGFTLIELLVVVLIIGILSSVALPQYTRAVARARTAEALSVIRSISQAAETYVMETGSWPESFDDLSVTPSGELATYKKDHDKIIGRYFSFVLIDGRVDVGSLFREDFPSFLYVSDLASSMKSPVPGKHLFCYYVEKGTAADQKMEQMCKAMGGGERHAVNGGKSIWFALD